MPNDIEKRESNVISLIAYKKLDQLFISLNNKRYAIIKGEPLSFLAYGKVGNRTTNDIDILVHKNDLSDTENILNFNGFFSKWNDYDKSIQRQNRILCLSSSHQVASYRDKSQMIDIDLNFDIFWGEYTGKRIDIAKFLSDTIELDIYGCKIKTLPPLKAMIQLILHHYKEMNSIYHLAGHNCINYNMFKDVYYLWKNNQDAISCDKLYSIVFEYEVIPFVFYILYYTNEIFKDSELTKYVEAFKTPEGVNLLEYYGLADNERKVWKVDFKTRLDSENMYELIKNELTEADIEKLERNRRIFRGLS